jgi:hypothetical protein
VSIEGDSAVGWCRDRYEERLTGGDTTGRMSMLDVGRTVEWLLGVETG